MRLYPLEIERNAITIGAMGTHRQNALKECCNFINVYTDKHPKAVVGL